MITASDYILMSNIIEASNYLKKNNVDISNLYFAKEKKEPPRTLQVWAKEFDNIRIKLKNSGYNLNIAFDKET